MAFRHYVEIESPSPAFDDLVFLTHRWDEYSYRGFIPDSSSFDDLMDTRTAACYEAEPVSDVGALPLVVYSAGWFNRTPDNTVLAEFLASHGFVVAAVPQTNPGLWTFNFQSDPASVEAQVRDLEVVIGRLITEEMVDRRRIVAMGYSTGGDVALLLQTRHPLVDAVVGLDASWTLSAENDVIESPFFAPERVRVPVLVVRRPTRDGASDALLSRLDSAPRIVVEIPQADHGSFGDDNVQRYLLGDERPEYRQAHAAVLNAVLLFLHALPADDSEFDAEELAQSYRDRKLVIDYLPATPAPASDSLP